MMIVSQGNSKGFSLSYCYWSNCDYENFFATDIFLDKWISALFDPLFKTGDPGDPSGYRPTSFLFTVPKVIEKIIADQLYKHMAAKGLFFNTQRGYENNPLSKLL